MRICQPVAKEQGIDNVLHGHFRSAPRFVVYDTNTNQSEFLGNQFITDDHDITRSLNSLKDMFVDVAIVGGVGRCALKKLHRNGFRVYQASAQTLEGNINAFKKGELTELTFQNTHRGYPC